MKCHYVPQMYLKRFAYDGKRVNCLFKKSGRISSIATKNICKKNDMYVKKKNGKSDPEVEAQFSDFESSRLSKILKYWDGFPFMVVTGKGDYVPVELRKEIINAITIQLIRGQRINEYALRESAILYKQAYEEIDRILNNNYPGIREVLRLVEEEIVNNSPIVAVSQYLDGTANSLIPKSINTRKCVIVKIECDEELAISDSPVLFYGKSCKDVGPLNVPLNYSKLIICYPLSPKLVVVFSNRDLFGIEFDDGNIITIHDSDKQIVQELNDAQFNQGERFVIARKKETLLGILKRIQ